MSRFSKTKQRKDNSMKNRRSSGGGGGNYGKNAFIRISEKAAIITDDGKVSLKGIIMNNAFAAEGLSVGSEVTVVVPDDRAEKVIKQLGSIDRHIENSGPTDMLCENCYLNNGVLTAKWITNHANVTKKRLVELPDGSADKVNVDTPFYDQFLRMAPIRSRKGEDGQEVAPKFARISNYLASRSFALVGPAAEASKEKVQAYAEAVASANAELLQEEDLLAGAIETLRAWDEVSVLERMVAYYDLQTFDGEIHAMSEGKIGANIRVISLDNEGETPDFSDISSYDVATIFGGGMKVVDENGAEGYIPMDARTAIERAVNRRFDDEGKSNGYAEDGDDDFVSYDDIIAKGVEQAMIDSGLMKMVDAGEEGEEPYPTTGDSYVDTLVDYLNFLQSEEAKTANDVSIEMIPVAEISVVGDTLKNQGKAWAETFNIPTKPYVKDGQELLGRPKTVVQQASFVRRVVKEDGAVMTVTMKPNALSSMDHKGKRIPFPNAAFSTLTIPTPATDSMPEVAAGMAAYNQKFTDNINPYKWKDASKENENENDHDQDEPEHDQENGQEHASGPKMG